MPLDPSQIELVAFDYGNTLIPFGHEQVIALSRTFHEDLERLFGPADPAVIERLSYEARMLPYIGEVPTLREHDMDELLRSIVEGLYGAPPSEEKLTALRYARHVHFLAVIAAEEHVHAVLSRLRGRYRLALLSNFPDGPAIRASLEQAGLHDYFEHIVISAEVGYVKPHPITFAQLMAPFQLPTHRAVYVGDNWLADIQGAKRIGMQAIHMRRWETVEQFPQLENDHAPDAIIHHLTDLESLLLPD